MWSNNILLYLIAIFILQSIRQSQNIVCNGQLNWARVSVFTFDVGHSISQRKCKRPLNMDHVLGSLAVKVSKIYSDCQIQLE